MRLAGRTVFIPGGTDGIGLAFARRLARHGSTVIVGGRRTDVLERLAAHEGFGTVTVDVADPASVTAASTHVIERHPELDVVMTMAGIQEAEDWRSPAGFLDIAERTVSTNLLGTIRLVAAFIEHLQGRPDATIITVSSGLAHIPLALTATYSATKAAVHSLSESLRLQLSDTSVDVIELVPPAVRTSLMNNVDNPRAMPLDAFVDAALSLLEQDDAAGEILVEDVLFQRFAERRGEYDQALAVINGNPHQG